MIFLDSPYFFVHLFYRLRDSNDARIARICILFRKLRNLVIVSTDLGLAPSVGRVRLVVQNFQVRVRRAHQPTT